MENIEQVFLYMKDEITAQASKEEAKILEEVNSLEQLANEQMEEEAKKDAALQMNQELSKFLLLLLLKFLKVIAKELKIN